MDNKTNFNPNEPVLWTERIIQQEAYNIGFNAVPKEKNPYPYNKGKNTTDWGKIKR